MLPIAGSVEAGGAKKAAPNRAAARPPRCRNKAPPQPMAQDDERCRILHPARVAARATVRRTAEFRRFSHNPKTGSILIEYQPGRIDPDEWLERTAAAAFVQERPRREPFSIAPLHSIRGRLRLRIRGLDSDGQELAKLTAFSAALPGITQADACKKGGFHNGAM